MDVNHCISYFNQNKNHFCGYMLWKVNNCMVYCGRCTRFSRKFKFLKVKSFHKILCSTVQGRISDEGSLIIGILTKFLNQFDNISFRH